MLRISNTLPMAAFLGALPMLDADAQDSPFPQVVTDRTRAYPAELERLQTPGSVFFTDECESDSGFAAYLEIRGVDDGRTRVTDDPALAYRGSGA